MRKETMGKAHGADIRRRSQQCDLRLFVSAMATGRRGLATKRHIKSKRISTGRGEARLGRGGDDLHGYAATMGSHKATKPRRGGRWKRRLGMATKRHKKSKRISTVRGEARLGRGVGRFTRIRCNDGPTQSHKATKGGRRPRQADQMPSRCLSLVASWLCVRQITHPNPGITNRRNSTGHFAA